MIITVSWTCPMTGDYIYWQGEKVEEIDNQQLRARVTDLGEGVAGTSAHFGPWTVQWSETDPRNVGWVDSVIGNEFNLARFLPHLVKYEDQYGQQHEGRGYFDKIDVVMTVSKSKANYVAGGWHSVGTDHYQEARCGEKLFIQEYNSYGDGPGSTHDWKDVEGNSWCVLNSKSGGMPVIEMVKCLNCGGTGKYTELPDDTYKCVACHQTGWVPA